jgi:hypothetical protein
VPEDEGRVPWRFTIARVVTADEAEDVVERVLAALDDAPGSPVSVTIQTPDEIRVLMHEDAPEGWAWSCDDEGRQRRSRPASE